MDREPDGSDIDTETEQAFPPTRPDASRCSVSPQRPLGSAPGAKSLHDSRHLGQFGQDLGRAGDEVESGVREMREVKILGERWVLLRIGKFGFGDSRYDGSLIHA